MKRLIVLLATLLLSFGLSFGANEVNIGMTSDGSDTLRVGVPSTIDIFVENEVVWQGCTLGFVFWSDDGVGWTWVDPGDGVCDAYNATPVCAVTATGRLDPLI